MTKTQNYIVDDLPTDKDSLDFAPYVDALVNACKTGNTPMTIGMFGAWGSGKTSLMKMMKRFGTF